MLENHGSRHADFTSDLALVLMKFVENVASLRRIAHRGHQHCGQDGICARDNPVASRNSSQ
jgi:hypothetical protein